MHSSPTASNLQAMLYLSLELALCSHFDKHLSPEHCLAIRGFFGFSLFDLFFLAEAFPSTQWQDSLVWALGFHYLHIHDW